MSDESPQPAEPHSFRHIVLHAIKSLREKLQEVTGIELSLWTSDPAFGSSLIVDQVVTPSKVKDISDSHGDGHSSPVRERDEVVSVCGEAVPKEPLRSDRNSSLTELRLLLWVYHTIATKSQPGGSSVETTFDIQFRRKPADDMPDSSTAFVVGRVSQGSAHSDPSLTRQA